MKHIILISFVTLLLLTACSPKKEKEKTVEFGKTITFDYAAGFDNGTLFDTSFEDAAKKAGIYNENRAYEPMKILFNKGSLFTGLEEALLGMKEKETKNVRIPPNKAYGILLPNSIAVFSKKQIENYDKVKNDIQAGNVVTIITSDNKRIVAYVKKVSEENVTVDLNHPLAGNYVAFSIVVREIE